MKLPDVTKSAGMLNILVADADPTLGAVIHETCKASVAKLRVGINADATVLEMKRDPADVLFVSLQIEDNGGLELVRTVKSRWPKVQVIAVSKSRRGESCAEAFRAGASDVLVAPVSSMDVQRALSAITARQTDMERLEKRNQRLRVACRRLNKARHEISQQVDLLCNDLVRAYQDMAQQLNLTQVAADYAGAVRSESGIEGLLRRTMEWILQKLGPVNAAVYLPAGEEHFALGAYLNLDTQADAALIETLGKTIVQQARGATTLLLDDDRQLGELFGDDAEPLLGRSWMATGCQTPRQCLAVLVVFRKQGEDPGTEAGTRGIMDAIAPVLADRIEETLGMQRRLAPFDDDEPENEAGVD